MRDLFGEMKNRVFTHFLAYHGGFLVLLNLVYFLFHSHLNTQEVIIFESALLVLTLLFSLLFRNFIMRLERKNEGVILKSLLGDRNLIHQNISHEIRTPLNAILGFTDDLLDSECGVEKRRSLEAIKNNGERLFSLYKKFIDLLTIETGQFKVEKDFFNNYSLLTNLYDKYSGVAQDNNVKFNVENRISDRLWVKSDYVVIFDILDFLTENALKFTTDGEIFVTSDYTDGKLVYAVYDKGCGVPIAKRELIFELYSQGDEDRNSHFEGLGLTIAVKLSGLLDGDIQYRENGSKGSFFKVSIPAPIRDVTPVDLDQKGVSR